MRELPEGNEFSFKDKKFYFSIATRPMELMSGLKGVSSLDKYAGMLFDFGGLMEIIMTPRGLLFPVELAFLSEELEVLQITLLSPELGYTQASEVKSRYALEVPVGFFSANQISVGDYFEQSAEYQGEKVTLNKVTRGDSKKFKVYVKNDKGNVVKVEFGDPDMEIKRDDPARRRSFRARHNCDSPGPRWKARYWSCKMWEADKSVTDYLKD